MLACRAASVSPAAQCRFHQVGGEGDAGMRMHTDAAVRLWLQWAYAAGADSPGLYPSNSQFLDGV
jgi:hypothetical protein